MTYQQNRGPPVPKQCFICRDNLPGSAPRMIEFRNEGYKPDGNPKAVMYEPNSNVRHIHYPRPQAPPTQQQAPPVINQPPAQQQPTVQQRNLPIDRIQETDRMQPDAPVQKAVVQQTPIAKTYQNNPDGTPKSWTMECDVCKQKGAVGQMICGVNVGFDTTTQQYVYFITDHDPNKPNEHNIKHVHREKPVTPEKPPEQKQGAIVPTMEQLQESFKTQMGFIKADRDKEQAEMKAHADKMLKATQGILATNEMYLKAIIRVINCKLNQLFNIQAAQFILLHPEVTKEGFAKAIETINASANENRELEFAEDAVIFDALNIYDVREAAVPTTADKLITTEKTPPEQVLHYEPTPGLCSDCGTQVPDINNHTCAPLPEVSFKPTQEELAQIQADEDETPDIQDDRVYRI